MIIALIFLLYFYKLFNINNIPYISFSKSFLKTGDLILFRWHSIDAMESLVTSFTHVGMVVKLNNNLYILETHMKGDTSHMGYETSGVNIYDLKNRINSYKGNIFLLPIKKKFMTFENEKEIILNITNYKKIPFHDKYENHFKNICLLKKICKNCINKTNKNEMFCSEFISKILQDINLMNENDDISCMTPHDLLYIKKNNERIFSNIVKLK